MVISENSKGEGRHFTQTLGIPKFYNKTLLKADRRVRGL
jgi:hypothetical protein